MNNRNKPVLTRDGKTSVHQLRFAHIARVRPEEHLTYLMALMQREPLETFSYVHLNGAPEYWEYEYIYRNWPQPGVTWEQWRDDRALKQDVYTIFGNFQTISCGFRVETRNPAVAMMFARLMQDNASWSGIQEWEAGHTADCARMRLCYGTTPEEFASLVATRKEKKAREKLTA